MRFVVGAGPTELHAHIDLDHRLTAATQAATTSIVTVIEATSCNGHSERVKSNETCGARLSVASFG